MLNLTQDWLLGGRAFLGLSVFAFWRTGGTRSAHRQMLPIVLRAACLCATVSTSIRRFLFSKFGSKWRRFGRRWNDVRRFDARSSFMRRRCDWRHTGRRYIDGRDAARCDAIRCEGKWRRGGVVWESRQRHIVKKQQMGINLQKKYLYVQFKDALMWDVERKVVNLGESCLSKIIESLSKLIKLLTKINQKEIEIIEFLMQLKYVVGRGRLALW